MNRYADFVCDHRGLLGLIILCCSTAAAFGLRHLEYDEEPRAVFRRGGEDFAHVGKLGDWPGYTRNITGALC